MQTKNDKSIYKQLLHIVAPISFQYLMASFVSASDAFMLGFLDQDHQNDHQYDGQDGGDDGDALDTQAAHLHDLGQEGDVGIGAGDTAGKVGGQVLQQIAHADGGDHDGHSGRLAQGLVGAALNGEAERDRQHDDGGNGDVQRHGSREIDHDQACDHEDIAVREVDQAQDTVDHGVADRDERILAAGGNTGEYVGQPLLDKTHGGPPE